MFTKVNKRAIKTPLNRTDQRRIITASELISPLNQVLNGLTEFIAVFYLPQKPFSRTISFNLQLLTPMDWNV